MLAVTGIFLFIFLILLSTVIPIGIEANILYDPLDGGWLEKRDGVKILHLSGTNYEMGYQHGFLLKDDIPKTLRMYKTLFESRGMSYEELVNKWNILKDQLPEYYKDELKGLVDSSGLTEEEIGVINI